MHITRLLPFWCYRTQNHERNGHTRKAAEEYAVRNEMDLLRERMEEVANKLHF